MSKKITIMVVPDHSSSVRRVRVSKRVLWMLLGCVVGLVLAVVAGGIHYGSILDEARENGVLRQQNVSLRAELISLHERTASIQSVLDRIQRFDTKLRAITQLRDPKRHLALGPFDAQQNASGTGSEEKEGVDPLIKAVGNNPRLGVHLLDQRLSELASSVESREESIRQLESFLRGQKARLVSTPSVWPTRGWVTSDFGMRSDPYTGKKVMHQGLDIANQAGLPVIAPANGLVIFEGLSGGFGKVLEIDHGYGIRTRFGHMEETKVNAGDHVERGDVIGTIGNTGRSTGPHLHYEVEVSGLSENPKNYLLED